MTGAGKLMKLGPVPGDEAEASPPNAMLYEPEFSTWRQTYFVHLQVKTSSQGFPPQDKSVTEEEEMHVNCVEYRYYV